VWAYLLLDFRVVVVSDVTYPLPKGMEQHHVMPRLGLVLRFRRFIIYLEVCKAEIKQSRGYSIVRSLRQLRCKLESEDRIFLAT
jgi:hypothetical protein